MDRQDQDRGDATRPDRSPPERAQDRSVERLRQWVSSLALKGLVVLGLLGVLGGGTALLHMRAAANLPVAAAEPLPVRTIAVAKEFGYDLHQRFAGRLEADRTASLAFERRGLVTRVLVDEGDRVEAGAAVAELDTAPLLAQRDRLVAQRADVAAQLDLARLTEGRQKTLAADGFSPQQRYDDARLGARALEARLAEVGAAIRALDIDIEKSTIVAPFAGEVAGRMIDEGTVVEPGGPVLELMESGRTVARIGVSPESLGALAVGQVHALEVGGRDVLAAVTAIRPDLQPGTRTATVLFAIESDAGLPFGEIIELELARRIPEPGVWLPLSALIEGEKGLWTVYRMVRQSGADGYAVQREAVEILSLESNRVFVRGSLEDGAQVVAAGVHRIVPGQLVIAAGSGE